MTALERLGDRVGDHARRMQEARRRYREDLAALQRWPGLDLERALWMVAARQRFMTEGRALADDAAELRMLCRAAGPDAPAVDEREVQAMVDELSGARPSTVTSTLALDKPLVAGGHRRSLSDGTVEPWPWPRD